MPVVNASYSLGLFRRFTRVAQSTTCRSMLKPRSSSCCLVRRAKSYIHLYSCGHEADRLLLVAGLLQELLDLRSVVLVPRQPRELRVPGDDLGHGQARVHPVELGAAAGDVLHDRLDVDRRLPGLAELLV